MVAEENVPQIYEEDVYEEHTYPPEPQEEEDFYDDQARLKELALVTMTGEFGFGEQRRKALGNDYEKVMQIVKDIRTSK